MRAVINQTEEKGDSPRRGFWGILSAGIGTVICLILLPILAMNLTIIVKSYLNPDVVPDFFGIKPFIVLSGSMDPTIAGGDLVVTRVTDVADLEVGDIISYKEGTAVITHRIVELTEVDGEPAFITQGDANNTPDVNPVVVSQVEGMYVFRIAGMGRCALFLQTPIGMLVFVGIPLCFFSLLSVRMPPHIGRKDRELTERNKK